MEMRFDGVLGLGLESLALDPEFSFYGQMARRLCAGRACAHFDVNDKGGSMAKLAT